MPRPALLHEDITKKVIEAFLTAYNRLGYGFSEKISMAAFAREARKLGLKIELEPFIDIFYDDELLGRCRVDAIANDVVVIEGKVGAKLEPGADQVFSYLRSSEIEVGLMLHFGPRPVFKRYIYTNDRKGGIDLYEGNVPGFVTRPRRRLSL